MSVGTTGIGSLPGEDLREWLKIVLDAVSIPFLPELPARPYGDMLSRSVAVMAELTADLQPAGWRLTGGSGSASLDQRRARSLLAQDLDALEELAEGYAGPLKVQVAGPWTLAATVERPRGDKILADHGARRDLADAMAYGIDQHLAEVRRRVPGAEVILQLDEPALPAVLAGSIPTASGWSKHRSVDVATAVDLLSRPLGSIGGSVRTVVHCCAANPPVDVIRRAGAHAVALDLAVLDKRTWEALAEAIEAGTVLFAGVIPTTGPIPRPDNAAERLTKRWRDLGLTLRSLDDVVVTSACGLAGNAPDEARARIDLLRRTAEIVAEAAEA